MTDKHATIRPGRISALPQEPRARIAIPRREFLGRAFGGAVAVAIGAAAARAQSGVAPALGKNQPLEPAWSHVLGAPVNSSPYGQPSKY
jgi:hypothetical protein